MSAIEKEFYNCIKGAVTECHRIYKSNFEVLLKQENEDEIKRAADLHVDIVRKLLALTRNCEEVNLTKGEKCER